MSKDFIEAEMALFAKQAKEVDIIIIMSQTLAATKFPKLERKGKAPHGHRVSP